MVFVIANFIFDWSGTLSDDFDMVWRATADVIRTLDGGHLLSEEEYREHFELPYMNFYRNYGLSCTKDRVDALFFQAVEHNGIFPTPLPHARELLEGLRAAGKKTYLFSAHPVHLVEREVAAFGFQGLFDGICAGVENKVVSLRGFVDQNGLDPNQTAYVGDLVHDVEAAGAASLQSVGVLSRYQSREKMEAAKPDVLAQGLPELLSL
ncbi:MAG: HAD hydrolase-like protein [Candidatus Micrarchaeota archaeon]|nr:HAD hydrolase-like protein [Candidatus Micrarchaeota archaeon]